MKSGRMLLGWCICLFACSLSFAQTVLKKEVLQNYVYLGEFSQDLARFVLQKVPGLNDLQATHTLKLYKIDYKTPAPDGTDTIASGLIAIPADNLEGVGIVSFQHGTRLMRDDVPSSIGDKDAVVMAVFASCGGKMIVMPDYLGLGDNPLSIHPYVQETLASSGIDMIVAAKELAKLLHYRLNNKLYLAGYSEGGYATLLMFESLVNNPVLAVSAVALGSAPYDWEETMRFVMLKPGPRATIYMAYFFYALESYKHYWANLDTIFVEPYRDLIPDLLDGTHTLPEILAALPADPRLIFQTDFFTALLDGTDSNTDTLKADFNHYDFTPNAPLLLVGTKGDHDVPYHGAELAYQVFSSKSKAVTIQSVSDVMDHIEAFPSVLKAQLAFFDTKG